MNLREYANTLPRGGLSSWAEVLGVSYVYLSQLIARQNGREPGPELSVLIEQATGGAVTRREVRPDDWWLIWPELITAEHPAPVEAKAA